MKHHALLIALSLLTNATAAFAQNTTASTNAVQPMTTASPVTAFFYQKPVVLDREQHKGLRIQASNALFAAKNQAVPLLAAEFPEASLEYPIVFSQGPDGQWMALALTGLTQSVNAFVDAKGQWNARYVPASVRRYPFILAETGKEGVKEGAKDGEQQLSLAADLAAPQLGTEGQALFDDKGEPTEVMKNIMGLLADFQNQAKLTSSIAQKLFDAGLLTQQTLQVRLDEDRSAAVQGVWIVNETKLRELPDDKILAWFKGGELAVIHAHMISLRNLMPLLERSMPLVTSKTRKKPAARKDKSTS
jgi:hypothetical protein